MLFQEDDRLGYCIDVVIILGMRLSELIRMIEGGT